MTPACIFNSQRDKLIISTHADILVHAIVKRYRVVKIDEKMRRLESVHKKSSRGSLWNSCNVRLMVIYYNWIVYSYSFTGKRREPSGTAGKEWLKDVHVECRILQYLLSVSKEEQNAQEAGLHASIQLGFLIKRLHNGRCMDLLGPLSGVVCQLSNGADSF